MHKVYGEYMRNVLAIPCIMGEKTPEERFAGADHTYTVEQIMQDGKALQAGTSHDLGQHFAKSCNIQYLGSDGQLAYAWTTSWGTSTRMMGGLFMTHSDDDGLVLPPAIAPYQVVIIPITKGEIDDAMKSYTENLAKQLTDAGIRVFVDDSDMRAPDKMWKWIKRGVPLRVEVGNRELESGVVSMTRRDLGKDSREFVPLAMFANVVAEKLTTIQSDMYAAAEARNREMIHNVETLSEITAAFDAGKTGFFRIKYAKTQTPEFDALMEKYKVTRRCLDDADPTYVFVAKSY
jgi:prolyl-tRNA synthetase